MKYRIYFTETNFKEMIVSAKSKKEAEEIFLDSDKSDSYLKGDDIEITKVVRNWILIE